MTPTKTAAGICAQVVLAVTTGLAIAAVAILLLLNPIWVGFGQDRADVPGLTGYSPQQVRDVTGSILADMVFGPPDFDATVDGEPVLTERERSHMADVRGTFALVGLAGMAAILFVVVAGLASRGSRAFWRSVRVGGLLALASVGVVGAFSLLFFDQAFELMHRVFFESGSYTFDPRTDRLVQLFPEQFWFETAVLLGVLIAALAGGTAVLARRLGRARVVQP